MRMYSVILHAQNGEKFSSNSWIELTVQNKAGYTAQDTPSTRLKITGDGRTDGPTDRRTDEHNLL